MRILIIRLSSLGDIVLQTPVVSWLKWQYPQCHITFLTAREFTPLLAGHPHIDEVVGMERTKGLWAIIELFKFSRKLIAANDIQLIIDLHGNTRSRLIGLMHPGTSKLVLDKRKFLRLLLVKTKINWLKNIPSIHWRNLRDFGFLAPSPWSPAQFTAFMHSLNPRLSATSLPQAIQDTAAPLAHKYIVISAVASFAPKRWPVEKYYALIEAMLKHPRWGKYHVVILGGKSDTYLEPLLQLVQSYPHQVHYLQGQTTLLETVEYLKHCSLCVGNDTGLGHIAEALGQRAITIFGPTHPDFGFGVHLPGSQNLIANVQCSPCSTLGDKPCKFQTQLCMQGLEVGQVLSAMDQAAPQ